MTYQSPERVLTAYNPNVPFAPPHVYAAGEYNKYGFDQFERGCASAAGTAATAAADEMSDMSSPPSPPRDIICFCGRMVEDTDGGIYCSADCARSDAFSSLCYRSNPTSSSRPPSSFRFPQLNVSNENANTYIDDRLVPSLASSSTSTVPTSESLSRNPSNASNASSSAATDLSDAWDASHYRRLARADLRKEERKEERRRRRADVNSRNTSTSSSISSTVPDLIGGHSRNVSVASTASSAYTVGSLSRNPSTASTSSSRRFGQGGVNVDEVIMEDEDEAEWLQDGPGRGSVPAYLERQQMRRRGSQSAGGMTQGRKKQLEAFGMGRDMRDVLEEILRMEREFVLSDTDEHDAEGDIKASSANDNGEKAVPGPAIFTATFDRPPRTPSPVGGVTKRQSRIPIAPGAPARGHRMSFSHSTAAPPMFLQQGHQTPRRRPPSMIGGHQSSLSESHTALYLATASPASSAKRSLSPAPLAVRKSLTFTPDNAGPSIGALRPPRFGFDSPGVTPSRRRGGNMTPSAHHPTMDGWKFPAPMAAGSTSNANTPTRPPPIDTTNLPGNFNTNENFATPIGPRHSAVEQGFEHDAQVHQPIDSISPQLLWPSTHLPPRPLAPALFPCSPALDTPQMPMSSAGRGHNGHGTNLSLGSGFTLGELMGSGHGDGDGDIEMDMEMGEDVSIAHAHAQGQGEAYGYGYGGGRGVPLYFEGDGFGAEEEGSHLAYLR